MKDCNFAILNELFAKYYDTIIPDLFVPELNVKCWFNQDEIYIINKETPTGKISKALELLHGKSDEVLQDIQAIFRRFNWIDVENFLTTKLNNVGCNQLTGDQERVINALRLHLRRDVERITQYWTDLLSCETISSDSFFNSNIKLVRILKHGSGKRIKNLEELFEYHNKSTRILITGDAGCGKSTFVHEIAKEWEKGTSAWTKKFSLLFLIRLGELKAESLSSLENLLMTAGLFGDDAKYVANRLTEPEYVSKSLFVFDGFDEMKISSSVIDKLISTTGSLAAPIIIASRPCERFNALRSETDICISVRGFDKIGAKQQLEKFGVSVEHIDDEMLSLLKIPLYNTLYGAVQGDKMEDLNDRSLIVCFIDHLFMRYRNGGNALSEAEEKEIKKTLGLYSQNSRRYITPLLNHVKAHATFFNYVKADYVPEKICRLSKTIGLIHQKSETDSIIFPHENLATYFAAYFWSEMEISIKQLQPFQIIFNKPENGISVPDGLFAGFLAYFCPQFNEQLWSSFNGGILPYFANINNLPLKHIIVDNDNFHLSFPTQPILSSYSSQHFHPNSKDFESFLEKARFVDKEGTKKCPKTIVLRNLHLNNCKILKRLEFFDTICFQNCYFSVNPSKFFDNISCRTLEIKLCFWKPSLFTYVSEFQNNKLKNLNIYGYGYLDHQLHHLHHLIKSGTNIFSSLCSILDEEGQLNMVIDMCRMLEDSNILSSLCSIIDIPEEVIMNIVDYAVDQYHSQGVLILQSIRKCFDQLLGFFNMDKVLQKNSVNDLLKMTSKLVDILGPRLYLVSNMFLEAGLALLLKEKYKKEESFEQVTSFESVRFFECYLANLKILRLYYCYWDESAITELANLLANRNLKNLHELVFDNCPNFLRSMQFVESFSGPKNLQILRIGNCDMSNECLSQLTFLFSSLVLKECYFTNELSIGDHIEFMKSWKLHSNRVKFIFDNCHVVLEFDLD